MSKLVELFGPELKRSGLLADWSLYVEKDLSVEVLANTFMEYLRQEDNATRQAFTMVLCYMTPRPWSDFLAGIQELLTPEELERFRKPAGEKIYDLLKLYVTMQVEDYWKEFLVAKQKEATGLLGVAGQFPSDVLQAKLRLTVQTIVRESMDERTTHIVNLITQHIKETLDGHGEAWKSGQDEPK